MGFSIFLIIKPLGVNQSLLYNLKQKCLSLYLFFLSSIYSPDSLKYFIYFFLFHKKLFFRSKNQLSRIHSAFKTSSFFVIIFLGQNILLVLKVILIFFLTCSKQMEVFTQFFFLAHTNSYKMFCRKL